MSTRKVSVTRLLFTLLPVLQCEKNTPEKGGTCDASTDATGVLIIPHVQTVGKERLMLILIIVFASDRYKKRLPNQNCKKKTLYDNKCDFIIRNFIIHDV